MIISINIDRETYDILKTVNNKSKYICDLVKRDNKAIEDKIKQLIEEKLKELNIQENDKEKQEHLQDILDDFLNL